MQELAQLTPILDLVLIGLGGGLVKCLFRIETRLTRLETLLETK